MADNKPVGLLNQVSALEAKLKEQLDKHEGLSSEVDKFVGTMRNALHGLAQLVDASLEVLGVEHKDKVNALMTQRQTEREQAAVDQQKYQLAEMVKSGALVVAEAVGELSVLTGRVFDKDGNVKGLGYFQAHIMNIVDAHRSKFLGQTVGAIVELEEGEKAEILEIFNPGTPAQAEAAPVVAPATDGSTSVEAK